MMYARAHEFLNFRSFYGPNLILKELMISQKLSAPMSKFKYLGCPIMMQTEATVKTESTYRVDFVLIEKRCHKKSVETIIKLFGQKLVQLWQFEHSVNGFFQQFTLTQIFL